MSNEIPLPEDLRHLIEKRANEDRRQSSQPEKIPDKDRRKSDRREKQ